MIADEAEPTFRVEALAVERDDAGGLLAPVLQRMQAKRGDRCRIGMAEDAEHAAFLAQAIGPPDRTRRRVCPRLARSAWPGWTLARIRGCRPAIGSLMAMEQS